MTDNAPLLVNTALLLLLAASALAVGRERRLFSSILLMSIFSLLCAALFLCLDAVDVALTEAAVGAGIATLLFLITLARTTARTSDCRTPQRAPGLRALALLAAGACGVLLLYGLSDMPAFGDPQAPVHTLLSPRYLRGTGSEIGMDNAVTAILASYRGHDTLGEVVVIFTALIAVLVQSGQGGKTGPVRPRHERESGGRESGAPWNSR